ncbi:MAG: dicarboxylate/amino acid:cation symporter [Bacteroidetes bacterium]|nr:dicarboxylate/amino acid:cation symporter [Bacteroidota bacterium]MBL6942741.1 dicarboxylate/amino acid:cation symporter [Bacteroidales bacterium]
MRKFALHWQILIALLLAIGYGLYFSTNYEITDGSIETLEKEKVTNDVINKLIAFEGKIYVSLTDFNDNLKTTLDIDQFEKYNVTIINASYSNPAIEYVSWMGDLFMRALKMLIIPLILSSLISGIINIGSGANLGRIGGKTLLYYISTSFLAILVGQILVNIIKPGVGAQINFVQEVEGLVEKQRSFKDILVDIVPDNVLGAMVENEMLSIIFFAILFGFFITKLTKKHSEFLQQFFTSIFEVMMKITLFVIKFTPLGVFGLVAKTVADQDDFTGLVSSMGLYMLTVIIALTIHAFVTLPLIVKFIGRANPLKHFKNMTTPLLTAFSTSSSAATLPLTINAVEEKSGVSNKISSFTLPLGATVNMDGTALYECVAAIFIAQAYGVDLTFVQQLIIVLTALLASIGAAAIPMAGLVMMTVILTAVGLPLEGVGLIIAVDRILDMFRTATNVWSDSCGAVVIAKTEGEELNV